MEVSSSMTLVCQRCLIRLFWFCCLIFPSIFLLKSSLAEPVTTASGNESDRSTLFALKQHISDPSNELISWNNSLHYCNWTGITCSPLYRDRVSILSLPSKNLGGILSPYVGNLTFLRIITLTENNFHGEIPQEIGYLSHLQHLNLNNNSFSGEIPQNISRCTSLRVINLIDNELTGYIYPEISSLSNLTGLGLADNNFIGRIPSSFGNFSALISLSLGKNNLVGTIPDILCQIPTLSVVQLSSNNLSGIVPLCLYNHSSRYMLSVVENQLEGSLPSNIGFTLPKIQFIYMGFNKFTGLIPTSLTNATMLEEIGLNANHFTGPVPMDLGQLPLLHKIYFSVNRLGSKFGDDLKFLKSLTNCSVLEVVQFDENLLEGALPESISNMSDTVKYLGFGRNQIHGSIPVGIRKLVKLETIRLEDNYLTGNIPADVGNLEKLVEIYLGGNKLSGSLPSSVGNMTRLIHLHLGGNQLSGSIPSSLGKCQSLIFLNLSHNSLIGFIPDEVIGLSSLTIGLHLQKNSLTGSLPSQVGNLVNIVTVDVSGNKLSGDIPEAIGNCLGLVILNMSGNSFVGEIPESLNHLGGLVSLDLSFNKLSGKIPNFFQWLNFPLLNLNLSFNHLEGEVPNDGTFNQTRLISIVGNEDLCGGIAELQLPRCGKKDASLSVTAIILLTVGSLCFLVLFCSFLVCCHRRKTKNMPSPTTSLPSATTESNQSFKRVSYAELHKATDGFSNDNLIGFGSYGSVFKGTFTKMSETVAVKVLNLHREGASKSFLTECNTLGSLRHRNLVKIVTVCSSLDHNRNDFKALVFEYMPNGSLEEWLHPRVDVSKLISRCLNLIQRLNIAIDVAFALEYLHHNVQPPIIHCDLKPSNVLLDNEMVAHVADFGIAKIFASPFGDSSQSQISSVVIEGSLGYVAPEYVMGSEVSIQGDMYSYGILLLEMFTGKRPTNNLFVDGLCLHSYAESKDVMEIADPMLLLEEDLKPLDIFIESNGRERLRQCLVSITRLGVRCSVESASQRMSLKDVIIELEHIKEAYQFKEPVKKELTSSVLVESDLFKIM